MASDGEYLMVGGFWIDVDSRTTFNEVTSGDLFVYHPDTDTVGGFGTGIDGPSLVTVYEVAITNSGVYIGGDFRSIDGVDARNLARLTQDGWSSLGVSVLGDDDPVVNAIVQNGDELYVAGSFDQIGVNAYNIAKLDLTTDSWSELGCGITRNSDSYSADGVTNLAVQPAGLPNAGLYAVGAIARQIFLPMIR